MDSVKLTSLLEVCPLGRSIVGYVYAKLVPLTLISVKIAVFKFRQMMCLKWELVVKVLIMFGINYNNKNEI